jgi:predicted acetylornithine/succinylornithine family transaminase
MTDWLELDGKYIMHTVNRVPVTLVRGEGARVWDDGGREYLDFVAGWAVNCLGHCHPVIADAVTEQARTLIQVSGQFNSIPQVKLAQLLVENSCLDKVFICNSGAEANEGAVKLARRYGALKLNGAHEVITATNSFHGRTLMMTTASGQDKFHKPYAPLPTGFRYVAYNDIEAIKAATNSNTCAVMLEPVQGESGVNIPDDAYLAEVRAWCDERGILLILDEVQTGIGRIGTLFGYQEYGIEPDIMSLAKGLGSGVPIGAFLAKEHAAVFAPGEHGSTFGGNPLTSAVAHAVVSYVIENDVPANARQVGAYLVNRLETLKERHPSVVEIRGRGLLTAIEFSDEIGQEALRACLGRGLLVNAVKPNALRFMPPLIIGGAEVDEAIEKLDGALTDIGK